MKDAAKRFRVTIKGSAWQKFEIQKGFLAQLQTVEFAGPIGESAKLLARSIYIVPGLDIEDPSRDEKVVEKATVAEAKYRKDREVIEVGPFVIIPDCDPHFRLEGPGTVNLIGTFVKDVGEGGEGGEG